MTPVADCATMILDNCQLGVVVITELADAESAAARSTPRAVDTCSSEQTDPLDGAAFDDTRPSRTRETRSSSPIPRTRILFFNDCVLQHETLSASFWAHQRPAPEPVRDQPSLLAALATDPPAVVLFDSVAREGLGLLRMVMRSYPEAKIIVLGLAESNEDAIVSCAEVGVAGFHLRSQTLGELFDVISRVAAGEMPCSPPVSAILLRQFSTQALPRHRPGHELALTVREDQILGMLELGLTNREISERLCIAVHTVKSHVHSLLVKLGVNSRAEAAARLRSAGNLGDDREN